MEDAQFIDARKLAAVHVSRDTSATVLPAESMGAVRDGSQGDEDEGGWGRVSNHGGGVVPQNLAGKGRATAAGSYRHIRRLDRLQDLSSRDVPALEQNADGQRGNRSKDTPGGNPS